MSLSVEVKVKEQQGGHPVKIDSFKGTPEQAVDNLLKKYVGSNGWKRLGALIAMELKK